LLGFGKKPLKIKDENGGEKDKMNVKYKKSLKIVTLLLSALVIASVSAATYSYMYIDGSITVGTAQLVWIAGNDAPGDIDVTGGTATMDLHVQPGINQNFTEALFLKNQDAASHNLTITVTSALSGGDFNIATAYIYENTTEPGTWTSLDTLSLTTLDDQYSSYTGNTPLVNDGYYRFTFEIQADAALTPGTYSFDIQVVYE
jgi:hypothetical protein